jgi:hypothetical protein
MVAGLVVERSSPTVALVVGGVVTLAATVIVAVWVPELRRHGTAAVRATDELPVAT